VLADAADGVVDRSLRPNFRALGPAFGADAPRVAAALTALSSDDVDALLAASPPTVTVDGRPHVLTAEMFEVVEMPRTGWSVAREGSYAVALDTRLTPDLEVEGAARELVRAANEQRKAIGLSLTDRIRLEVALERADLAQRLDTAGHAATLAREVLATGVDLTATLDADVDGDGTVVSVALGTLGDARLRVVPT
jgi:isoleucyl-tRNA synthetase